MAGVLAAGTASAAGGTVKGDKGPKAGASSATPVQPTTDPPGENTEDPQQTGLLRAARRADKGVDEDQGSKSWDVSADVMFSHLVDANTPCTGSGPGSKEPGGGCGSGLADMNYTVFFGYNLTSADRLSASFNMSQSSIIDQGDDSFRAGNVAIGYSHTFALPEKFNWTLAVGTDIPTGYSAQRASEITVPHASSTLSRRFGGLLLSTTESFRYGFYRCREMAALVNGSSSSCDTPGGVPNQQWGMGASVTADYTMPFFEPLSAGLSISSEWGRAYMPGSLPVGGSSAYGATNAPGFTQGGAQPISQSYGWTVFMRYTLPEVLGLRSDALVAYGLGDGLTGVQPLLHDGIIQKASYTPYLAYREASSIYGSLTVRY